MINNSAVFSENKSILLKDYGVRYSPFNSIYNARLDKRTISKINIKKYDIEAVSMDDYVENNSIFPNFIKIDAESSEYDILLGMQKTIEKYYPIITIEVGDIGIKDIIKSRELIEYLLSRNYLAYNYVDGEIKPHCIKNERYRYDNLLFVPIKKFL